MESGRRRVAAVDWAGLPAELLAIISGGLGDRMEIVRFRSVCKPWRLSTPLPTNKLSPLFPLESPLWAECNPRLYDRVIRASAVYLVRPRSDPCKVWLVSVHEASAGNLVLRDALLYKELNGGSEPDIEVDRIAATQTLIARSYAHYQRCTTCNGLSCVCKVVFVCESGSGFGQLVGLCVYPDAKLFGFRLDWRSGAGEAVQLAGRDGRHRIFYDLVKFNGRIFAVDAAGIVYLLDHTNLELLPMTQNPVREDIRGLLHWVNFVVSDGDLYLVWLSYEHAPPCQVYRLVVVTTQSRCSGILVEQVRDLRDCVFFVTRRFCFSVSATLLPPPWKGNCVFIGGFPFFYMCRCTHDLDYNSQRDLFHLEDQTFTNKLFSTDGYSDLFSPPASFVLI